MVFWALTMDRADRSVEEDASSDVGHLLVV